MASQPKVSRCESLEDPSEGIHGSFCLLPRHIDVIAVLVPGLLSFEDEEGREKFVAIAGGTLVKQGPAVAISTRAAVTDADLGHLHLVIEREYRQIDDMEKAARSAVASLEADFVRRLVDLEGPGHA